jgi:hypothetical protein
MTMKSLAAEMKEQIWQQLREALEALNAAVEANSDGELIKRLSAKVLELDQRLSNLCAAISGSLWMPLAVIVASENTKPRWN